MSLRPSSISRRLLHQRLLQSAVAVVTLGLMGCASVPPSKDLSAVSVNVPEQWSTQSQGLATTINAEWWVDFRNAEMDGLIRSALDANRDLRTAAARLAQARAMVSGAEAERRPQLGAIASAQRGRESSDAIKTERSTAGLHASWEVDVFGRGALAIDAAQADALSASQALAAARIALAADVATAYFELRTLDSRVNLRHETMAVTERQLQVAQRKFDAGQSSALDVDRWQAELAQERATVQQLVGDLQVRQRQLAALLGASQPPRLNLQTEAVMPSPPPAMLPAELLERRPDVQRQARAVDAALARLGVARREIYPRLQIDWAGSRERLAAFSGSASPMTVVGYGISVSLPILDSGRIRANVEIQEARAQEAMASYEQSMIAALADAEASLAQWSASDSSVQELQRAQDAWAAAAQRAVRLFDAGLADASAVLDARREHLRAQESVRQAEGARWISAVKLRRVFAGTV